MVTASTTHDRIDESLREITGQRHPLALTVAEAARALNLAPITVRRMLAQGTLARVRYPGLSTVRIPAAEIYRIIGEDDAKFDSE